MLQFVSSAGMSSRRFMSREAFQGPFFFANQSLDLEIKYFLKRNTFKSSENCSIFYGLDFKLVSDCLASVIWLEHHKISS